MNKSDEDRSIRHLIARLEHTFPILQPTLIEAVVHAQLRQYEASRIRDYIPILVERYARDILRTLAAEAETDNHRTADFGSHRPTNASTIPSHA